MLCDPSYQPFTCYTLRPLQSPSLYFLTHHGAWDSCHRFPELKTAGDRFSRTLAIVVVDLLKSHVQPFRCIHFLARPFDLCLYFFTRQIRRQINTHSGEKRRFVEAFRWV